MTSRAAILASLAVLVACGRGAPRAAVAPRDAASHSKPSTDARLDTDAILATVVKVRGLVPKRPIAFQTVGDDTFVAHYRAQVERYHEKRGLPGQAVHLDSAAGPHAYYDIALKTVFLRERPLRSARETDLRAVVAHELVHALQDQYFDIDTLLSEREVDVFRAHTALIEGDATATTQGAAAVFSGLPPKRAIVHDTAVEGAAGFDASNLGSLAPSDREELTFPYVFGAAFVGAIVRTGGFPLVDRVFRRPPSSTAEIIHPEVYLEGRTRNEVAKLEVPKAYAASGVQGAVGEFALRNVLTRSGVAPAVASELAAGWRGDLFVSLNGATGPASVWTIVCADKVIAASLRRHLDGGGVVAVQEGNVLGVTAGITGPQARELARKMTKPPVTKPKPAPPVGVRTLAPMPPSVVESMNLAGAVREGVYRNPTLGLSFDVPPGMALQRGDRYVGFVDRFASDDALLLFAVAGERPTPAMQSAYMDGVLRSFEKYGAPEPKEQVRVATGYGSIDELRVRFPTIRTRGRIAAISICKNEATMYVVGRHTDDLPASGDEPSIDAVLAALKPSAIDASPFCKAITTEHTTDLP